VSAGGWCLIFPPNRWQKSYANTHLDFREADQGAPHFLGSCGWVGWLYLLSPVKKSKQSRPDKRNVQLLEPIRRRFLRHFHDHLQFHCQCCSPKTLLNNSAGSPGNSVVIPVIYMYACAMCVCHFECLCDVVRLETYIGLVCLSVSQNSWLNRMGTFSRGLRV